MCASSRRVSTSFLERAVAREVVVVPCFLLSVHSKVHFPGIGMRRFIGMGGMGGGVAFAICGVACMCCCKFTSAARSGCTRGGGGPMFFCIVQYAAGLEAPDLEHVDIFPPSLWLVVLASWLIYIRVNIYEVSCRQQEFLVSILEVLSGRRTLEGLSRGVQHLDNKD